MPPLRGRTITNKSDMKRERRSPAISSAFSVIHMERGTSRLSLPPERCMCKQGAAPRRSNYTGQQRGRRNYLSLSSQNIAARLCSRCKKSHNGQQPTARHQTSKHNGSHRPTRVLRTPSTNQTRTDTAGKSPKPQKYKRRQTNASKKGEKEIIYAAKSGAQKRASKAEKLFFDGCSSARASSPAFRGRLRLDAARERSSRARSHSLFLPQSPSQAGQRRPLLLPLNRFDDRDIAKPWRDYAYAHRSAVQISIGVSG